jgi:hypothetical protein
MRLVYSIIFLVFIGSLNLFGQAQPAKQSVQPPRKNNSTPTEKNNPAIVAKNTSAQLKKLLGLSEKQKGEIYKVVYNHAAQTSEIQKSRLSTKEKYKKIQNLDIIKAKKFESILTKEQYNLYIKTFP